MISRIKTSCLLGVFFACALADAYSAPAGGAKYAFLSARPTGLENRKLSGTLPT